METPTTEAQPVRVAIVDDSRSIRRWLRSVLDSDDRFQVVAEASNGIEAREMLRQIPVDIMTLDVDMPEMNGIDFLSRLMAHRPMPVVMLSALTEEGSSEAVEALSLGAVDCIEKPRTALSADITQDICDRVWQAAQTRVYPGFRRDPKSIARKRRADARPWSGPVVLLGASTGGVAALEMVLSEMEDMPCPVVIAQHMPMNFLRSFSRRLNEQFSRRFVLAEDGLVLESNQAVIAVGKTHSTRLSRSLSSELTCVFGAPSKGARYHPSVDDLFHSAAQAGLHGCAALLTGMGDDGANGLKALRAAGFTTLAQNEASCVVFGMPKAAIALDAAQHIDEPGAIGKHIASILAQQTSLTGGPA